MCSFCRHIRPSIHACQLSLIGGIPLINSTKNILADAFEDLLQTKSFDEITVTDIVNHCGAARSTFYKYFSDKYDIMIWKYENALNEIHIEQTGIRDWREGTRSGVLYLANHRDYFLKITDYKGQNSIHDFLYEYAYKYTYKILCRERNLDALPVLEDEALKIYLMGTSKYLMGWLKTMHMSVDALAELLCDSMPELLKQYFE